MGGSRWGCAGATSDNGQRVGGSRWGFAGATSDNGQQTTEGGGRWSFAGIMELRNYGTTDRASRLKAQSLSIPSILSILSIPLYTPLYSLYPSIPSILMALRLRSVSEAPIITHSIFLKSSSTSEWDMVSISNILVKKVTYLRRASFRIFTLLCSIRFLVFTHYFSI